MSGKWWWWKFLGWIGWWEDGVLGGILGIVIVLGVVIVLVELGIIDIIVGRREKFIFVVGFFFIIILLMVNGIYFKNWKGRWFEIKIYDVLIL